MVKAGDRGQTTNQTLELPPTHQPVDLREGLVNAYNVVSTVSSLCYTYNVVLRVSNTYLCYAYNVVSRVRK